jgi:hypothetical protein
MDEHSASIWWGKLAKSTWFLSRRMPLSATIQAVSPHALAPDILAFAAEQEVMPYLQPLLEMTRQVFNGRPVSVSVDEDPEIANDRHIVIDVDVSGLSAKQMFESQQRWLNECFEHCPATHVCVFSLGMVDRA